MLPTFMLPSAGSQMPMQSSLNVAPRLAHSLSLIIIFDDLHGFFCFSRANDRGFSACYCSHVCVLLRDPPRLPRPWTFVLQGSKQPAEEHDWAASSGAEYALRGPCAPNGCGSWDRWPHSVGDAVVVLPVLRQWLGRKALRCCHEPRGLQASCFELLASLFRRPEAVVVGHARKGGRKIIYAHRLRGILVACCSHPFPGSRL